MLGIARLHNFTFAGDRQETARTASRAEPQEADWLWLLSQSRPSVGVQAVMGAKAGEFGAVASQGRDVGTASAAGVGGRPNSDEPALLGSIDPAGTDENVTHIPPEAHFGATDPCGRGDGTRTVQAEGARAVSNIEHIDVDRIVSRAAAAPDATPLLAVPRQERDVLTHPR
jgi:hypothetical protein